MSDDLDARVQISFDREAVRDAILALAKDLLDGHADPADNSDAEAAVLRLADLLGNVPALAAAEGVQLALLHIWTDWVNGAR